MTSQIVDLNEIFKDSQVKPKTEEDIDLNKIFSDNPKQGTEEALAEYVGQETLGEPGLKEPKIRGQLSAADTFQEKQNQFKELYPNGELVFVPGGEGNPSGKRAGEILFRTDMSSPWSKLDARFFEGGGNEFLSDLSEFLYDDIGVIAGEIAAGSKKVAKIIAPFTKSIPVLGGLTTSFELFPMLTRMGIYAFGGELAQEGVQELKGINEQSFKDIAETAGYKGLLSSVGTGVLTVVTNKIGNVFSGRGFLKRSDEAGTANKAVDEINEVLKELNILNSKGEILQVPNLPANLLVDSPIVEKIGKQIAATGGKLSGAYRDINETLATALQNVGDAKSAAKLINLLDMVTNLEKNRLFDLINYARLGDLQFDQLSKKEGNRILNIFGIKDIKELKNLPQAELDKIIEESMEAFSRPGGALDLSYNAALKAIRKFKPDGIQFDLTNIKEISTKGSFGITQKKKKLNMSSDDLQDYILSTFGKDRLSVVTNRANKLITDEMDEEMVEQIYSREYRNYIVSQQGSDPLIKINQVQQQLNDIFTAFRDIGSDGSVTLPAGAAGPKKTTTFDFLFDARKQLNEILGQPVGNVSTDQKRIARELLTEIDQVIKNPANSDEAWKSAYEALVNISDEQIKLSNLPIILGIGKSNYTDLLKGYMSPNMNVRDLKVLSQTLDPKANIAFKQGVLNQLIGDSDKLTNLPKILKTFDKEALQFIFDKKTFTALENLSGFMQKLDETGFQKVLDNQVLFAKGIDSFMSNKNTKGINEALDFIKNLDGGFNSELGKSFHDGIVNRLFQKSTSKVKGKLTLNQSSYRTFIDELKLNGIFETFNPKTQKLLENVDLVKDFLVQGGDAGTSLEAAALASQFKSVASGGELMPLLRSVGEIIGFGKLFTSTGGRAFLIGDKKGAAQLTPGNIQRTIGAIVTELTGSNVVPKQDQNLNKLFELLEYANPFSSEDKETTTSSQVDTSNADISTNNTEPLSFLNKTNVNPASRLGQTNIAPPVSMAAADPNTMDRGQELFGGPREITFASQGGIMNSRRIMQRVI